MDASEAYTAESNASQHLHEGVLEPEIHEQAAPELAVSVRPEDVDASETSIGIADA